MGNGEFQIPNHLKQQWEQSSQHQSRLFTNTITLQTFELIVSPQLQSDLYFAHLIERSIYPIPKTPKIILLNDNYGNTAILAQKRAFSLKAMLAQVSLQLQLYKIIKDIAVVVGNLFKRFGPFGVTGNMIGGTTNSDLIVWVNQNFELCEVQLQIAEDFPHQQTMLLQFLQIVRESTSLELSEELFTSPPTTFDLFIEKINELIKMERCRLMMRKISINSRNATPPYPLSPRKREDHSRAVRQNRDDEAKRKRNIPNFIKSFKEKKVCPMSKADIKNRETLETAGKWERDQQAHQQVDLFAVFQNVNRIRSLNVSPCSKLKAKQHHNNSSLTTNYSLLSFQQSFRQADPQYQRSSEKDHCQAYATNDYQEVCNSQMKRTSPNHLLSDYTFQPVRQCTSQLSSKEILEDQQLRQKDRPVYQFGSLNLRCKNLSQSVNLAESIISEVESHYLGNLGIAAEENADTIRSELMAILSDDGKREERDI